MTKKFILPAIIFIIPSLIPLFLKIGFYESYVANLSFFSVLQLILQFVAICLILARYKKVYCNGVVSFKEAFVFSFKVILICAITVALVNIVVDLMNPEASSKMMSDSFKVQQDKIIAAKGAISAGELHKLKKVQDVVSNPIVKFLTTLLVGVFGGIIYSLIGAAIFKTNPVE